MATYSPSKITKDGNTYNFTDATKIPLAGTNALAGSIVPDTNNAYDFGSSNYGFKNVYAYRLILKNSYIVRTVNNDYLGLCGGTDYSNGAYFTLYGKDSTVNAGAFRLRANDGINSKDLIGKPDGTLTWRTNNIAMQEDTVPRSGGAVMWGDSLGRNVDDNEFRIDGGSNWNKGSSVVVYGKDHPYNSGCVYLVARDGTNTKVFIAKPDGTLTWGSKNVAMQEDVIPRSGGAVMRGTKIARTDASNEMNYCGGTSQDDGATLILVGKNATSNIGGACIKPKDGTSTKYNWMRPDGTWTWNGTACQIISDQRLKQQITEIDDKLLDAWESVELCQFKYNDAVDQKGDKARLHTGYVVQQIDNACKSHGVDISEYGLYCHEEYPQETKEVEVEQVDGTKTKETKVIREASEHYSLRYTEALIVECAYLRKCIKELRAEIEQLKSSK